MPSLQLHHSTDLRLRQEPAPAEGPVSIIETGGLPTAIWHEFKIRFLQTLFPYDEPREKVLTIIQELNEKHSIML